MFFDNAEKYFSNSSEKVTKTGDAHRSSGEREKKSPAFADAKGGEYVETSHAEHKRHTFDSFCKKVLKNEARNIYDEIKRQGEYEVSFSELSTQELNQLLVMDEYPSDFTHFRVLEYCITVKDPAIAGAIAALPDEKRDIILLSYWLDMTDGEIGAKLNMLCRTVQRRRTSSERELKNLMEGTENE